jgi:osmotically-inducible protein OsmY
MMGVWAPSVYLERSSGMETQYSKVLKDISDELYKDPRTKGTVIDLGFNSGILTMTGKVKDVKTIQAAEEIALSHPEVISIINELKAN